MTVLSSSKPGVVPREVLNIFAESIWHTWCYFPNQSKVQAMSRVNKERLAVLLEETRQGSGSERYAAALRSTPLQSNF